MVKKKKNITILIIVIVSIVIVGGVLTWGFMTNWGQGKKSEQGTKSEPVKYTVPQKIPKGNKIEIENPESHGFKIGQEIEIGTGENRERRTIVGFGSLILDRPLIKEYPKNTEITVVKEPVKKDFKVDNCKEYTVDLTCKECGDSYYLEDNICKKYSYTGTKDECNNKNKGIFTKGSSSSDQTCVECEENKWVKDNTCQNFDVVESLNVLKNLIKESLPNGYEKNDKDEYIRTDGSTIIKNYGPMRTFKLGESIKDLSRLFKGTYNGTIPKVRNTFNKDISGWDVSNVTDMSEMFRYSAFNGDISKWNVGNVTTMKNMFRYAEFNGDISDWDVRKVTNMYGMFYYAFNFNQPIGKWRPESVTTVERMLWGFNLRKLNFYQDLNSWCPWIKKNNTTTEDLMHEGYSQYFDRKFVKGWWKGDMTDAKSSKIMWYFKDKPVGKGIMTQAMKTKYTNAYNNC